MADITSTLTRGTGEDPSRDVAQFLKAEIKKNLPLLAWADPDPMAVDVGANNGKRMNFPLSSSPSDWPPANMPLIEARLFWKDSALHLVANDGGGCRWVSIKEAEPQGGEIKDQVTRRQFKVVALADHARFGLEPGAALAGLQAIEYRQRGRLVGWRLITEGK